MDAGQTPLALSRNLSFRGRPQSYAEWKAGEQTRREPGSPGGKSRPGLVEYATLELRVHPPEVSVDNHSDDKFTVITVDSANKPGTLLEVVSRLTDLHLNTSKAYISSDGGWFVDVFHVTDASGQKIQDKKTLDSVRNMLPIDAQGQSPAEEEPAAEMVSVVECWGDTDRVGLLSEITSLLAKNDMDLKNALVWTHGSRFAQLFALAQTVKTKADAQRLKENLVTGMSALGEGREEKVSFEVLTHVVENHLERRLHRMMMIDGPIPDLSDETGITVNLDACMDSGYTVIRIESKDRPRLMFDTVCTLAEIWVDVHHGSVDCTLQNGVAVQEYYVRHVNGEEITDKLHLETLRSYLKSAIVRRNPKGLKVQVACQDRVGLLADMSLALAEAGLNVTLVQASREGHAGSNASEIFHVMGSNGTPANRDVVEHCCKKIGGTMVEDTEAFDSNIQNRKSGGFGYKLIDTMNARWGF